MSEAEVFELVCKEGQLVMQSTQLPSITSDQIMIGDEEPFVNDDEMISWLHYPLIDDPNLKSIFYDQLLYIPPHQPMDIDENDGVSSQFIPLDTTAAPPVLPATEVDTFCGLFSSNAERIEPGSSDSKSVAPVVVCGSVSALAAVSSGGGLVDVPCDGGGGVVDDRKRKGKEKEKDDSTVTVEFKSSINTEKQACGSISNKRTRAAQVHNLSERKRRDKINEKMKILQHLIPRCNKMDKVSMLDDAIIYLKSLQMQVGSWNVAPTVNVPSMETNVNNPLMQYPNTFTGVPKFPKSGCDTQFAPACGYPTFHMGHVPNSTDPSTIQEMNQSNHMQCLPGTMQNVNQPNLPISLEQYQQFLQMHMHIQMQMQMHMLAAANLSNQSATLQGTHNQQIYPGYGTVDNHNPGNRAMDPRELFSLSNMRSSTEPADSKVNREKA